MGLGGLSGFAMHIAFGQFIAEQIDWPNSPFQNEVAFANLTIGILGLSSFWRRSRDYLVLRSLPMPAGSSPMGSGMFIRWLSSPMMLPPMLEQSCLQTF